MRILLVDDSLLDRLITKEYLEEAGNEVILGVNGQEAIDLYCQYQPDLVILDEVMPVMQGHEAAKAIRDLEKNWVPIIFLSGRMTPDDIVAGIEAGGDDYLSKPVDQKMLAAKLNAMSRIATMRQKLLTISDQLEEANKELQYQAEMDGLTELANRRYLDKFLSRELSQSSRLGFPLSIIMCDVDEFKLYNDEYGHLAGDDCLKLVAGALKSESRRLSDLVARYGGEEYVIVLSGQSEIDAISRAEILRDKIEDLNIPHKMSTVSDHVTVSFGVYSAIPGITSSLEDFIAKADLALYASKQVGKNCVTSFSAIPACDFESLPLHPKISAKVKPDF